MAILTREEVAKIEIGQTNIAPVTTWSLVTLFVLAIAIVPVLEMIAAREREAQGATTAWSHLVSLPRAIGLPLIGAGAATSSGLWGRIVGANRLVLEGFNGFERGLEDESVLGRALRPPAQILMTRVLGAGNERVYPGRDGWVFYRPDVEYVTGRPFLDRSQLERRIAAAPEWEAPPEPDPRPAIERFRQDLEARGITLVVVPTPGKGTVHPERLTPGFDAMAAKDAKAQTDRQGLPGSGLQNASFERFVTDLQRAGVLVFDPAPVLVAARTSGPQYLATDTHWRPEAMELVAEELAQFVQRQVELPGVVDPGHRIERVRVANIGDTARMLDLPETAVLYPPETVWQRRILRSDGTPWRSSRDADVLVLGDSFTNIFALESMGWGTSGGFAEQLSHALRRPVDRLVQNDQGAFATRAMVQQDPGRLAGKRVVVYQFAARELAFGDWRMTPLAPLH